MPRSVLARMAQRCATPTVQGLACAVLAIVLFSSFTVLSRLGLTASALAPWDLAMLRFGIAGLVLVPVLLRRGWGGLRLVEVAALVLTGGLGFALFAYAGFRWAPASYGGALLHGTIPLFTLVLAGGLSRQRVPTQAWLAGLLMLVGIAAIAADSQGQPLAHPWLGGGALLLAALCWSAYGLLCQRLRLDPLHAVAIVATGSLLVFLPIYGLLPAGAWV